MIYITPLLNQLDPMISDGQITDATIIAKIDQAWDILEHPATADSIAYYDLLDEIRVLVEPLISAK